MELYNQALELPMEGLPPERLAWLAAHAPHPLFASPDWHIALAAFEQAVGQPARQSWVFVERDGATILAFALERRRGPLGSERLRLLGNYYSPLVGLFRAPQLDEAAAWQLLFSVLPAVSPRWLRFDASPLDDAQLNAFEQAAQAHGLAFDMQVASSHFSAEAKDYWDKRPPILRNTLRRKGKQLERRAHRFEIATQPSAAQLADYWTTYALSWKIPEPRRDFVDWLMGWAAERGMLRLGLLYVDDKVVAAQCWLVQGGCAYIFKLSQDQAADALSPGSLLMARLADHVCQQDGVGRIDFLLGADRYKSMWMERHDSVYHAEALRRSHALGRIIFVLRQCKRVFLTRK